MEEISHLQLAQSKAIKFDDDEELAEISLRPLDLPDINDFMVWASDEKVTHFCTWDPYTSKEEGMNFIKNVVIPHPWFRAICLNNKPIGAILVMVFSGSNMCRGEPRYALGSKYWGKGIATQAVKLVVGSIFKDWLHLERLEALVDVANIGSERVLVKAGFTREGVWRKYYMFKGRTREPRFGEEKEGRRERERIRRRKKKDE